MARIDRKTEIGSIDGTPDKRVFWSIMSDYGLETGLLELVDNAIDLWTVNGKSDVLETRVTIDGDRQFVAIADTAGGVRREDLKLLITPGGSNNSPDGETIGIFGVGSKRAVVAIGEHITIKTRHEQDDSYEIDIDERWLDSPSWELPFHGIPEIAPGGTLIELSRLRRRLDPADEARVITRFGETYGLFLEQGECLLSVNGRQVEPVRFDLWAYPPGYLPRTVSFQVPFDEVRHARVTISAGLIRERDPSGECYGVYFYCNDRLIMKEVKTREVGFSTGEAGQPHSDASLCRAIVTINGPARIMPWTSNKTAIDFAHPIFEGLRPTLVDLLTYYSKISRALRNEREAAVYPFIEGHVEEMPPVHPGDSKRLVLPPTPKVRKSHVESVKAINQKQIDRAPWALGLLESVTLVDWLRRQRNYQTRNRLALLLLDSSFEIGLKEYIVHRTDLFLQPNLQTLFKPRDNAINAVNAKVPLGANNIRLAKHYYEYRNKMIHERATIDVTDADIEAYRGVITQILKKLYYLKFDD